MPLSGNAFLCLWNGYDPAREAEYERWHSFEHVPERVAAPGFLAGWRYAGGEAGARLYMTLYDLEDLAALETPEYAALQAEPTPWSARMRTGFRDFLRIPCVRVASEGTGRGAHLAVQAVAVAEDAAVAGMLAQLRRALAAQEITAFHLGQAEQIPAYGVFDSPAMTDGGLFVVALVETTTAPAAQAALARLNAMPSGTLLRSHCAALHYAVARGEVVPQWERRAGAFPQAAGMARPA